MCIYCSVEFHSKWLIGSCSNPVIQTDFYCTMLSMSSNIKYTAECLIFTTHASLGDAAF